MRYDDRLATVLRLTPVGPSVARIQFRQLLDLLGTMPADERGELVDRAFLRLAEIGKSLPVQDRADILAGPGLRLRSPRLVAMLARGEAQVALAAVMAAQLSDEQWVDLIPALPLANRGLLRARKDLGAEPRGLLARLGIGDQALPSSQMAEPVADVAQEPLFSDEAAPKRDDIGTIVRRIEAFRRNRVSHDPEAPHLPLDLPMGEEAARKAIAAFDFLSDGEGRIIWSESHIAPMVVGHQLNAGAAARAVRLHQPLRALRVELAGALAIAGAWQVDAVPRFDAVGGRFLGHQGRFRRPVAEAVAAEAVAVQDSEADRLRQLLHELRTPVNAIQGFAEIIQQQLFGAAPHEYRALAAGIAADAARMLAGFEELDRYAKLESGALALGGAGLVDLADCLANAVERFTGMGFHYEGPPAPLPVALSGEEAERLCWRLLATLAGNAAQGEALPVAVAASGGQAVVRLALPRALAGLSDADVFSAAAKPVGGGMFGTGFALRLAQAEARAAGGQLLRDGGLLILSLPLQNMSALTGSAGDSSESTVAGS